MSKENDRTFLLKCIETYKSLPALWKIRSDEYTNRDKKNAAYKELLTIYQEKYPNANKEDIKKKFNSLRTNFRKELKKVNSSKKSGAGRDDLYESTLWYFNDMKFLTDQETPDESISTITFDDEDAGSNAETSQATSSFYSDLETPTPPAKKKKQPNSQEHFLSLACERLREPQDNFDQQASTWANELKSMEKTQQVFAKKFINDILFEGQLGTLHRESVVINSIGALYRASSYSRDDDNGCYNYEYV